MSLSNVNERVRDILFYFGSVDIDILVYSGCVDIDILVCIYGPMPTSGWGRDLYIYMYIRICICMCVFVCV